VVLDILITAIERMADYDQQQKKTKEWKVQQRL
jgi:hypothetical protein